MIEFSLIETILSGGLGVTIVGWAYQSIKAKQDLKEARLKAVEEKLVELDKIDAAAKEGVKRVHDRMDNLEHLQGKLEVKIDKDMQDVKHSIDKLTDLVIKALQTKGD